MEELILLDNDKQRVIWSCECIVGGSGSNEQ